MNRRGRLLATVILLLLTRAEVCLLPSRPVQAWGEHGHRISAQAAAQKLPAEMPLFFRQATDQPAYLNPEPDRWRDEAERKLDVALNSAAAPEHYGNFERLSDKALAARHRYDYLTELTRAGVRADQAGLLPFEMLELFQRLRVEFRLWRTTTDEPHRRFVEGRIINDASLLGHYVTDRANPHHTTVHHNGWSGDNPRGYATDQQFHARLETNYVQKHISVGDLLSVVNNKPQVMADPRAEVMGYLRRSHREVETLYDLDKRARFDERTTSPENKRFAVARLAAGAEMLRDLWWTAWVTSEPGERAGRNVQAGKVDKVDAAEQVLWRIDVGSASSYTDTEGRVWSPDTGLFTPERAFAESRGKPAITGAADPTIYHTYRGNVGVKTPQAERILTFEIPVLGQRRVDLRLHFVELYWGAPGGGPPGPGKRIFDVEAEGRTVLTDFDITKASGAALTTVVVPIKDVDVRDEKLTLVFRAKKDFAAVSAIEVLAHDRK